MEDVEELIGRQIDYNTAISDEGLKGNYGVETGRILMENAGNASGLNRGPPPGPGRGRRRQRQPDERMLPAGSHQQRQRQPASL